MTTITVNQPIPFSGTREQRRANVATHDFVTFDGSDYNCTGCDCKPGHVAAGYPCGANVPRETVVRER